LDPAYQVTDPIAGDAPKRPRQAPGASSATLSDALYTATRGGQEFLQLRRSLATSAFYGLVTPD
jgi:hypothetical protein